MTRMQNAIAYQLGDCDTRPWGRWEVISVGNGYIGKEIHVEPGEVLSLQRHQYRSEHWIILEGQAQVTLDEERLDLSTNDTVFIASGVKHRISNSGADILSRDNGLEV